MIKFKTTYPLLFCLVSLFSSCTEYPERKEIVITDFEEKFIDSLVPTDRSYTTYYIKVKGYANDSIRIIPGLEGDGTFSFYFSGNIDEELRRDYYGTFTKYFVFDPYKATEGNLEIEYKLL